MRILIVEDSKDRIDWFMMKLNQPGVVVDVTCNGAEAIEWLQLYTYTYIFLDHDLADSHYLISPVIEDESPETRYERLYRHTGTGRDVSMWLAEHPEASPEARINIHSLNETGSKMMQQDLAARKATRTPFGYFDIKS